jgi:prephenate dehydrogenase
MRERIGIVGWGRFGQALGGLFAEAGHEVHAYDPTGVAGVASAESVAALAAGSGVIVLAVPIGAIGSSVREIAPHVDRSHLVLDVASVKTRPTEAMEEVLGVGVPWVATHPLFGPTSLALGERPLRVIVCPNRQHSGAVERASSLYESAGCLVTRQSADEHDREMAETHALAYFVAKAMIDADVRLDAENAPPSSRAMLRTVEAVRSDAGHLFLGLHRDNPYAAGVRRRFLDALAEVDRTLVDADAEASGAQPSAEAFAIPDLGARSPEIREVRDLIDDVDREIVSLLARRAVLARRAGQAKAGLGVGVRDPRREAGMLEHRREWAERAGIEGDLVASVFEEILRSSRRLQARDRALP